MSCKAPLNWLWLEKQALYQINNFNFLTLSENRNHFSVHTVTHDNAPWKCGSIKGLLYEFVPRGTFQVACNSDMLFMDIDSPWKASVGDATLFKVSRLNRMMDEDVAVKYQCVLLADSAYPCLRYLMTPVINGGYCECVCVGEG